MEFASGNNFGFSAFSTYGSFWISFALIQIDPDLSRKVGHEDVGLFLIGFTIYSMIMFIASCRLSTAMATLFGLLVGGLVILDIAHFHPADWLTKFGGAVRVQRVHAAVAAAGLAEGITFNFDRITRTPSTLGSHRLIRYTIATGCEGDVVEALYRAYFIQGLDIGDKSVLADIGASIGLERKAVLAYLLSDTDVTTVLNDNARAHRLGVNGVPCLIIDGNYALAGAQEPDILLRLIDIVREAEAEAAFS